MRHRVEWDSSAGRADDPLQQKLWHSGRWLHVIAYLGEGKEHINIQVVFGIAGNTALNCEFWETIICYPSGLENTDLIVLTDANFSFDTFNSTPPPPPAPLVALADGLIDIDLAHAQLHGTTPSVHTREGMAPQRASTPCWRTQPTQARLL